MVHVSHIFVAGKQLGTDIPRWAINGHAALILFFVMSGYVLFGAMRRTIPDGGVDARAFIVNRVFRIYPATILSVLTFSAVFWWWGYPEWPTDGSGFKLLLANIALIDIKLNGVMWTLRVEVVAIPLMIVTYLLWRSFGERVLWLIFFVLAALSFSKTYNQLIDKSYTMPLHAFIAGMIAVVSSKSWIPTQARNATLLFYCALAGVIFARPLLGWNSNWAVLVEVVFGAVLIVTTAQLPNLRFVGWLDWRVASYFGQISFSFYLLHFLAIMGLNSAPIHSRLEAMAAAGVPLAVLFVLATLALLMVITPIAWLMHIWVELPSIELGKRVTVWMAERSTRPAPVVQAKEPNSVVLD